MKSIRLAPDLEKALLRGIIEGVCSPSIVNPEELSKKGKAVFNVATHLIKKGVKPPLKRASLALAAAHNLGMEKETVASYLQSLDEFATGDEIGTILRTARDKATLISLVNQAGEQLASGDLRISDLTGLLAREQFIESSKSFSHAVNKKWPKPPRGIDIPSLPVISDVTPGVYGLWIVAGEPGLGKTTLIWQIALDLARDHQVIYYDLDGTGEAWFIERTRYIAQSNVKRFKRYTRRIHFRHSIASLEQDIAAIPPPAVICIDSVQTLPIGIKYAKESLDNWIRRFKELVNKGYSFLMTSEKARSEYGEANMGGFKGSGDIEYAATVGAHLLGIEDDEDRVKFVIVKNRHGKKKGYVADLVRDEKKTFWWKEEEPSNEEGEGFEDDDRPRRRRAH